MGQLGALLDFSGDKLWLSGCLERAGDSGAECNSFHPCWLGLWRLLCRAAVVFNLCVMTPWGGGVEVPFHMVT